jgi:hypothetical protein
MVQLRQELAEEKARLQEVFQRELKEDRSRLDEELARKIAEVTAGANNPPAYPPPPPREVHLVLNEDLSNLPGRRLPLPSVVTFRGQSTRDRERIKILLGYARFVRCVPGSIFTDPLADLQDLLLRVRGKPQQPSPAPSVSRSRSRASEPPQSGPQNGASTSQGRSRSPFRQTPPSDGSVMDRIRRLEHRMDEAIRELREGVRQNQASIQRLEELVRKKTVHQSSLQGRSAPPGLSRAPVGTGEDI